VNHILIVKLGAIGDVVHALPAAAALRRALPAATLTWVVERGAAPILRAVTAIDRLIEIDTRNWRRHLLRRETRRAVNDRLGALRAHAVDVAIDMQGLLKSGLAAWASGAPRRVGFATSALREPASRAFLTEQVDVDDAGHVIEKNLALVRHLGIDASGPYEFPIAVSAADEEAVRSRLPHAPFAVLNPGGGWPTKLWSAEAFGRLADALYEQHGLVSLVSFGPGEETLARRVVAGAREGRAALFASTLPQFVVLARHARVFVGGDTGPLHLAAAAGAPIVGIYGPTDPARNGPFAPGDETVGRSDLGCRVNCYRRSCDHWECLDIPVETVQRAVDRRLQTTGASPRPLPNSIHNEVLDVQKR
jgi:heptosyltransferase-1